MIADNISVTVLGGYLGAGKTTLLNHLLRTSTDSIAVLVNDFGSINVDAALIESSDDTTITLSNGCICCSLTDGFGAALQQVREMRAPERLVIEASGVADPASVAAWGHGPGFTLDGVVTVVDIETLDHRLRNELIGDVVAGQIRSADLVIANKTDLVDPTRLAATRDAVRELTFAPVIDASYGAVSADILLGPLRPRSRTDLPGLRSDADIHTTRVQEFEHAPTFQQLESFLDSLPATTLRAKGFVQLADGSHVLVQVVGARRTIVPADEPPNEFGLVLIDVTGAPAT